MPPARRQQRPCCGASPFQRSSCCPLVAQPLCAASTAKVPQQAPAVNLRPRETFVFPCSRYRLLIRQGQKKLKNAERLQLQIVALSAGLGAQHSPGC